jgi:hypothetical protein
VNELVRVEGENLQENNERLRERGSERLLTKPNPLTLNSSANSLGFGKNAG